MLISALLTWALSAESKKDESGNTLFLQHGDTFWGNMLWTDENHFVFIDLDSIGYYPPLYDVIWFLWHCKYDVQGMVHVLHENYEELLDAVCIKAGIDITDNPFDILFSEYVMYMLNNGKSDILTFSYFSFFNVENTQPYPKTNQLLRTWHAMTKSEDLL
jgi:thiamine kinase-like enzyme